MNGKQWTKKIKMPSSNKLNYKKWKITEKI